MEDIVYIQDLIKYYIKNILIVAFITISFFTIGTILKKETTNYYEETTTIMLGNQDKEETMSTSDLSFYSNLLDNYLLLLDSKKLANNVINNLNLNISAEELLQKAIFSKSENSQMILITVKNKDDLLAANIANEFVKELKNEVQDIYYLDNIVVIDTATPSGNIIIEEDKTILITTIIGFLLASSLIIGIYCLNDNVRIMMRKENILGAEILRTSFYKKKQAPSTHNRTNENNLRRIKSILHKLLKTNQVKTIMITSDGNRYHSNYSVDIASTIANVNKKTLLIDCNINGNLSDKEEKGILELICSSQDKIDIELKKILKTKKSLDFIPLGNIKQNSIDLLSTPEFINILDTLKTKYDAIFLEVPDITKSFEGMVLAEILDCAIVVMKENKITRNNVKQFHDKLENNQLIAIAPVNNKL